jgi:glycosyltransferase involved in cell wall biosynthesis
MRLAYLINQYPMVSHSFIRREILALERQGFAIMRIALRGWDAEIVDEEDRLERERTRYVLRDGAVTLSWAFLRLLVTRPVRMGRALAMVWRMGMRAERPLPVHFIYLAEACRIVLWLRAAGVHHLHAHFGTNSAEVALLAHNLGGPRWSFTVHGPEEFDKAALLGLPEKVRQSEFVVGISSFGRSQLYRYTAHRDWPKIHVVHCGLEAAFHAVSAPALTARKQIVCVGRLCEQKGQLWLIEAARRLAAQGVDFHLVLAGDGELRFEIAGLIEQYNLQDKIRITGWINSAQVRDEILASRALVLPSFAEGLPVVIMEAMSLRRPVISTYVAGIPELILPGEHGWLVPAADVDSLAQAIKACLDAPPAELARMGGAAHARVVERHNIDTEAAKLATLFRARNQRSFTYFSETARQTELMAWL